MRDSADRYTADLLAAEPVAAPATRRGRPAQHADVAARMRAYRARKRAEREARRDPAQPLHSALIDLSELPAWRVLGKGG